MFPFDDIIMKTTQIFPVKTDVMFNIYTSGMEYQHYSGEHR